MEAPIGYGSMHRSILPESQLERLPGPSFKGAGRGSPKAGSAPLLIVERAARGARSHSGIDRHKVRMASELLKLGLIHALEYGVASADLKPPTPSAMSRFP